MQIEQIDRYTMQKRTNGQIYHAEENKWTDITCRRKRTNGQIYHAEKNKWTDIPCRKEREQMDRYTMQKGENK